MKISTWNMNRVARVGLTLLFLTFVTSLPVQAQTASTGTVLGMVKDPSGAIVPSAAVELIDTATQGGSNHRHERGRSLHLHCGPARHLLRHCRGFRIPEVGHPESGGRDFQVIHHRFPAQDRAGYPASGGHGQRRSRAADPRRHGRGYGGRPDARAPAEHRPERDQSAAAAAERDTGRRGRNPEQPVWRTGCRGAERPERLRARRRQHHVRRLGQFGLLEQFQRHVGRCDSDSVGEHPGIPRRHHKPDGKLQRSRWQPGHAGDETRDRPVPWLHVRLSAERQPQCQFLAAQPAEAGASGNQR